MAEEDLNVFLRLAEMPLKKMLKDYFIQFLPDNLLDICEEYNVSTSRIPKSYIDLAKLNKLIESGELPIKTLGNNSLLKIPNNQETIKIVMPDESLYHLYVINTDKNHKWNESLFTPFEKETEKVKKEIGKLMNITMFAFNYLQTQHSELKTISIETDPVNVTLFLKDSILPGYIHPMRISFTIN
jgi:hypothetical protein